MGITHLATGPARKLSRGLCKHVGKQNRGRARSSIILVPNDCACPCCICVSPRSRFSDSIRTPMLKTPICQTMVAMNLWGVSARSPACLPVFADDSWVNPTTEASCAGQKRSVLLWAVLQGAKISQPRKASSFSVSRLKRKSPVS